MNLDEMLCCAEENAIKAEIEKFSTFDEVVRWSRENGLEQSEIVKKKIQELQSEQECKETSMNGEEYEFFWGNNSVFSQWYRCVMIIDGIRYSCAEQYMMYQKAILMGDKESAQIILSTQDPREQKRLGRHVKHFKQDLWNKKCQIIVKKGNTEKFRQNQKLAEALIATYPKIIVEASPFDKIWGIGLRSSDKRAKNKKEWKGKNLLGFILTAVRDEIMSKR
ncbi:hypothetical protein FSP39_011425 [Pinctada imbricata]|uniref:NADAR domain-containing protein n=1 Tax=Pinctada imbricata TaxID=66713 RepID=A0AA88YAD3_PINIB|nr:hypothetical protein FSP39_011425 [Pinctada imbricata]